MTDNPTNDNPNEDDIPGIDDEPRWDEIMQHSPSKSQVSAFLAARRRRDMANERFAAGLDTLHESVQQSMDGLVEIVSTLLNDRASKLYEYEMNLKNDYVSNEKTRANMQTKLEESARAAQGMFANLLMRVAKPGDAGGSSSTGSLSLPSAVGNLEHSCNDNNDNNYDRNEAGDLEPDWDAIMMHEPARSEVPNFLDARGRRDAACSRFETAIEEFQTAASDYAQELTQAVADVYNSRTTRLDEYEQILKHNYVANDEMRTKMQSEIEESATAAHNMFEELMMRVMQPQQQQRSWVTGSLTQAVTLGASP